MGYNTFDQYSLLHFSVGVIFYFWNTSFPLAFLLHTMFEFIENTNIGMKIINNVFVNPDSAIGWPGGKDHPDSFCNILGDTITFSLGWNIAYLLDEYGKKNRWFY